MNENQQSSPVDGNVAFSAEAIGSLEISTVKTREPLAIQHLFAARHFATLAAAREQRLVDNQVARIDLAHRSYVMAAVKFSTSFMEALVNDIFGEAADPGLAPTSLLLQPFTDDQVKALAAVWNETEVAKTRSYLQLMDKFQKALVIGGTQPFPKADATYQSASDVVFLRNYLVHFKTEWHESGVKQNQAADVQKRLMRKFDENAQNLDPWFPNRCLGAGCADWAHRSALAFADAWVGRLGVQRQFATEVAELENAWIELDRSLGAGDS